MRVVIAPDSFKESASAPEVANALAEGWRRVAPEDKLVLVPMADGGEGTVDALVAATDGRLLRVDVTGPLGETVTAEYGLLRNGETAIIEMASASGLPLVPPGQRDPRVTTTRGTGELMRHALDAGVRRIIVGIGGSATNDGGAGMAHALGYQFLDHAGKELAPGGAALSRLTRIDASAKHPALDECEVLAACDVDNPLCGPRGASCVYGPQKGANAAAVTELDGALRHLGETVESQLGTAVLEVPGAGAAGGLGAGLVAFAGAGLRRGVDLVAEASGLAARMAGADLAITGEGRIDGQTAHGKTPAGVAAVAKGLGIPVVAVAGALGKGYEEVHHCGIDAVWCICPGPMPVSEALIRTPVGLREAGGALARLWHTARNP